MNNYVLGLTSLILIGLASISASTTVTSTATEFVTICKCQTPERIKCTNPVSITVPIGLAK